MYLQKKIHHQNDLKTKISLFTNLLKILEFLFEAVSVGGGHGAGGWAANIFKLCGRLNEF